MHFLPCLQEIRMRRSKREEQKTDVWSDKKRYYEYQSTRYYEYLRVAQVSMNIWAQVFINTWVKVLTSNQSQVLMSTRVKVLIGNQSQVLISTWVHVLGSTKYILSTVGLNNLWASGKCFSIST